MKWILCGKNAAAVAALEHLRAKGDEVWAVGARGDDGEDGWQPSFRRAAERLGVRFDQPRRINDHATIESLAGFGARALISIQYDQILRGAFFAGIGCPCLNLHFALLPRHRGVAPIAWAILAGDAEAGVTLHHMVEAIDAGDVLAEKRVEIGPEETGRELYDRVSQAAVELFIESHPFPKELLAERLPQDGAEVSYHRMGDLDFSQRSVDWSRDAGELQRWLRALVFPPLQHPETQLAGRALELTRVGAEVGAAVREPPGTVVEVGGGGARVACGNGTLWIRALRDPCRPARSPGDLLGSLRVGDRLGSDGE